MWHDPETLAYVHQLTVEHAHIRERLFELTTCTDFQEGSSCVAVLRELHQALAEHVESERIGSCLELAACSCPTLAKSVEGVQREQRATLRELVELLRDASHEAELWDTKVFQSSLANWIQRLTALLDAERKIVAHAFGTVTV